VPGGLAAALFAALMLVVLAVLRRGVVAPVWRAFLPEVPPA
jgi:hypothetical protein